VARVTMRVTMSGCTWLRASCQCDSASHTHRASRRAAPSLRGCAAPAVTPPLRPLLAQSSWRPRSCSSAAPWAAGRPQTRGPGGRHTPALRRHARHAHARGGGERACFGCCGCCTAGRGWPTCCGTNLGRSASAREFLVFWGGGQHSTDADTSTATSLVHTAAQRTAPRHAPCSGPLFVA
jgi:hypothetical protein